MPITKKVLSQYADNKVFIETGFGEGKGVAVALACGFDEIYSIEFVRVRYSTGIVMFNTNKNVTMILGDSVVELPKLLESIAEPCTIWLDAHCDNSKAEECEHNCPVLLELEAIAVHPIKNHTILIDDIRLFRDKQHWKIHLDEILKVIPKINPEYQIKYVDGRKKDDILVAYVEK